VARKRKWRHKEEEVPVNFCPLPDLDPEVDSAFCERSFEMLRSIENLLLARKGFANCRVADEKGYWHEIYLSQLNNLERLVREIRATAKKGNE
jgi:hypothetical protein